MPYACFPRSTSRPRCAGTSATPTTPGRLPKRPGGRTSAQQDVQALHRLRAARLHARTALCNQGRGLLAEYGVVLA